MESLAAEGIKGHCGQEVGHELIQARRQPAFLRLK